MLSFASVAFAQYFLTPEEELEAITKPEHLEWCDSKKIYTPCYDGISYIELDKLNIDKELYPKNKTDYLILLKEYKK